jgi:tripartite-type tricarboxylate transporter receptor subunit TctC
MRRPFRTLFAMLAMTLAVPALAQPEPYPSRPIRLVVSTAVGGSSDVTARILADAIRADLGQPVVVENRVGASGTIGAASVAKAAPDGYTLFFGTGSTHVVAPAMMKGTPYDPVKDFVPITLVGRAPFILIANAALPVKSIADVIALAKARPGGLSFGTTGPATIYEVAALTLASLGGVKFNHVPYKGFAPMTVDLAAGSIDLGVGPVDGSTQTDRIRTIAVLGARRVSGRPDTPSATEQGFPGFDVPVWAAVYAPAGTPRPIAAKLTEVMRAALARPEVRAKIAATGIEAEGTDDAALLQTMSRDLDTVRQLMKQAGVEPQ